MVFAIIGRIRDENVGELEALFEIERQGIILDLKEVNLVGREAVGYLARCEKGGARLRNCPAYIREWIAKAEGN